MSEINGSAAVAPSTYSPVVARGEEEGVAWETCRAPIYDAVNGYVRVPEGHPWAGLDYVDIDVQVHGGLTYSADGWIGFDAMHSGDYWPGMGNLFRNGREWTAEQVADETRSLARQVAEAGR